MRIPFAAAALGALLCVTACAGRDGLAPNLSGPVASALAHGFSLPAVRRNSASGKIQHVVYIIQENRSFNNLFMGYPGAVTQNYGYAGPVRIKLHAQSLATTWDIDHSANGFFAAYDNGKLDGWDREYACCGQPKDFPFAYTPKKQVKTYWQMAQQYVLADNLFQSHLDGSYISHQYAIAAYANHEVNFPSGAWSCLGGGYNVIPTLNQDRTYGPNVPTCEDYTTLGDELDAASLSWRSYTAVYNQDGGIWNAYSAISHIVFGPDWSTDVVTPASRFITDVGQGSLAAVTWITPTGGNSDHAGSNSLRGPSWVASLVDAVGQSQFWDSTAIFIIWDDWGGWFDPVAPVYLDYDGTGFRVPLIAISAYAKQGYVSHVQYEASSVLRFMEDTFGLAPLAASDARAADPSSDFFDFTQAPRPFKAFSINEPPAPDGRPAPVRPPVGGD